MRWMLALLVALTLALSGVQPAVAQPKAGQAVAPPSQASAAIESLKTALLDINTAPVGALEALPGIGAAYAKRIVDNRPYTRKDELVRRKILPQSTYDRVKELIIAKQAPAGPQAGPPAPGKTP